MFLRGAQHLLPCVKEAKRRQIVAEGRTEPGNKGQQPTNGARNATSKEGVPPPPQHPKADSADVSRRKLRLRRLQDASPLLSGLVSSAQVAASWPKPGRSVSEFWEPYMWVVAAIVAVFAVSFELCHRRLADYSVGCGRIMSAI